MKIILDNEEENKPYIIKIKENDSSLFNCLWFQIDLNIPYKKLKGEKD